MAFGDRLVPFRVPPDRGDAEKRDLRADIADPEMAVSIAANVAEGSGRRTTTDLVHFLTIARRSLRETETYLVLLEELGYVTDLWEGKGLADKVGRELSALIRSPTTIH